MIAVDSTGNELGGEVPNHEEGCDVEGLVNVCGIVSDQGLKVSKEKDDQDRTKEELVVLLFFEKTNPEDLLGKEVESKDRRKDNSKERDSKHSGILFNNSII